MMLRVIALFFACVLCIGNARRIQTALSHGDHGEENSLKPLAFLLSFNPAFAFSNSIAAKPAHVKSRLCDQPLMGPRAKLDNKQVLVVLSEDLEPKGKKGDIVAVMPSYFENCLQYTGKAQRATPEMIKELEKKRAAEEAAAKKELQDAQDLRDMIEARWGGKQSAEKGLVIKQKAGPTGTLFGKTKKKEIITALKKAGFDRFSDEDLVIPRPIARTGINTVELKLHPKVICDLVLDVQPEKAAGKITIK